MEDKKERALLVGLNITSTARRIDDIDIDESMEELKELTKAAGAEVVGSITQNRQSRDAAYYIGKGKVEELRAYCESLGATMVIFNDELSGAHIRNIEEIVGIKVIDRTTLILDIFAQRALSKEGKLQVELAQLKYRLPRLYGMGGEMSRTGAGIGTRGPGEQKLEVDKRHILNKAADIRRELNRRLAARNWYIMGLRSSELTLEDIFLKLTMGETVDEFMNEKAQDLETHEKEARKK